MSTPERNTQHRARKDRDLIATIGTIGLGTLEHRQRTMIHGGPASGLASAGAAAQDAAGTGEQADLVVVAVTAGQGPALVNALKALGARG